MARERTSAGPACGRGATDFARDRCQSTYAVRMLTLLQSALLLFFLSCTLRSTCSLPDADIRRAFPKAVWAYRCTACSDVFLRPSNGLRAWKYRAFPELVEVLLACVRALPAIPCKSLRATEDFGIPHGTCDRCYCRSKRARLRKAPAETNVVDGPVPPSATPTLVAPILCEKFRGHSSAASGSAPVGGSSLASSVATTHVSAGPSLSHLAARVCTWTRERAEALNKADFERHCVVRLSEQLQAAQSAIASARAPPPHSPSCSKFLALLRSGAVWNDRDGPTLQQIAAAILLHDRPPEFRVKRANGRESVYVKRMSPLKARGKRSQRNRRSAIGSSLLAKVSRSQEDADVASNAQSVAMGAVASCRATVAQRRRSKAAQPLPLTPEQQLRLIETYGVSLTAFNGIRRVLGGSRAGLASQPVLRAARARLADLPAKRVTVTRTGAHLVNLNEAVAEKLTALSASNGLVERLIRGADLVPIPQTEAYSPPSVGSGSCPLAASSPPNEKDVHLALGLDKGGSPSSVKVVLVLEHKKHPHRLSNTILVAVYPAEKDSYDEASEMQKEHLQQVRDLVREGVVVNGERRAVRLFLSCDYEALCTFHGHKGESGTMSCLMCYTTKTACASHAD